MAANRQLVLDLQPHTAFGREDFLAAPCNEAALAWIEQWPDWPAGGVALWGPPGSGKSTMLRMLCRMNERVPGFQVEGQVVVLGRDIHDPALNVYELRKQVGMVFQKPCVFPQSIYENVIFGLKFHAIPNGKSFPERSERALRDVFLWDEVKDRLHDPAHTLSQGQQIGRASCRERV